MYNLKCALEQARNYAKEQKAFSHFTLRMHMISKRGSRFALRVSVSIFYAFTAASVRPHGDRANRTRPEWLFR